MRRLCVIIIALAASGCACSRYQITSIPAGTYLIDSASGKTWTMWVDNGPAYWKEMRREPASQPADRR